MLLLLIAALGALPVCPLRPSQEPRAEPPRPNVILFVVDDLGAHDVGFMGNPYIETPRADGLAREGLVFTAAYANAPNCSPSRAALLTGTWPPRTRIYTVNNRHHGEVRLQRWLPVEMSAGLEPEQPTLPAVLRAAGWRTAAIGKWHLASDPLAAGFDVALGGDHRGAPREGHFSPYGIVGFEDGPAGEPLAERLCDEALAFIDSCDEQPFFLYLSHYSVHTPIQAPAELKLKYEQKTEERGTTRPGYAAMVEALDLSLGRLLAGLEERGLTRDTIVVFLSDNGGHENLSDPAPLRGGKGMLSEGGLRIPLAVRWPAGVRAGGACAEPVILSDLAATLLDACGVQVPQVSGAPGFDGPGFDGPSLLPLLQQREGFAGRALFWHFPVYLKPDRKGGDFRSTPGGAVRRGEWKLIESFEDGGVQLFDLAADPGEEHDLAREQPERAGELLGVLRDWRARVGAEVPAESNPEYDPEGARAER